MYWFKYLLCILNYNYNNLRFKLEWIFLGYQIILIYDFIIIKFRIFNIDYFLGMLVETEIEKYVDVKYYFYKNIIFLV